MIEQALFYELTINLNKNKTVFITKRQENNLNTRACSCVRTPKSMRCFKEGWTLNGRSAPKDRLFIVSQDNLTDYFYNIFNFPCNTLHYIFKKQHNVLQFLRQGSFMKNFPFDTICNITQDFNTRTTKIQLFLLVHRQVCCDNKLSIIAVNGYVLTGSCILRCQQQLPPLPLLLRSLQRTYQVLSIMHCTGILISTVVTAKTLGQMNFLN